MCVGLVRPTGVSYPERGRPPPRTLRTSKDTVAVRPHALSWSRYAVSVNSTHDYALPDPADVPPEIFGAWLRYAEDKDRPLPRPSVALREMVERLRAAELHRGCVGCRGGVEYAAQLTFEQAERWERWEQLVLSRAPELQPIAVGCPDGR